jgi:hypothetical protein
MPKLHDAADRGAILTRVRQLRPDSQRRWGRMSIGQMLWHVNQAMETALGRVTIAPVKPPMPLPKPLLKFVVINMPWPRGAWTLPKWIPQKDYDFTAERDRCLKLIDDMAAKRIDDEWPLSPTLGRMTGSDVTRLHAKHLDHHLKQFGV